MLMSYDEWIERMRSDAAMIRKARLYAMRRSSRWDQLWDADVPTAKDFE